MRSGGDKAEPCCGAEERRLPLRAPCPPRPQLCILKYCKAQQDAQGLLEGAGTQMELHVAQLRGLPAETPTRLSAVLQAQLAAAPVPKGGAAAEGGAPSAAAGRAGGLEGRAPPLHSVQVCARVRLCRAGAGLQLHRAVLASPAC